MALWARTRWSRRSSRRSGAGVSLLDRTAGAGPNCSAAAAERLTTRCESASSAFTSTGAVRGAARGLPRTDGAAARAIWEPSSTSAPIRGREAARLPLRTAATSSFRSDESSAPMGPLEAYRAAIVARAGRAAEAAREPDTAARLAAAAAAAAAARPLPADARAKRPAAAPRMVPGRTCSECGARPRRCGPRGPSARALSGKVEVLRLAERPDDVTDALTVCSDSAAAVGDPEPGRAGHRGCPAQSGAFGAGSRPLAARATLQQGSCDGMQGAGLSESRTGSPNVPAPIAID